MQAPDLHRVRFGYDRAGNRLWRENLVADDHGGGFDELYAYDGSHRLADMQRGDLNAAKDGINNKTFAQDWALDPLGNWGNFKEDSDGDGAWDLDQNRTANAVNEITDITETAGSAWATPGYDRAGNMTSIPQPADPTQTFSGTYDAWNRLVKLVDDGTADTVQENEYDGARRRTLRKDCSAGTLEETWHFYYTDRWQSIEERLGTSTSPDRQFVWGLRYIDGLICRDRDTNADGTLDERLYALQDANWNVTAIIDTAGAVQERYAYSAYGGPNVLTSSFASRSSSNHEWDFLYTGRRFDIGTCLFYYRSRYYHLTFGCFTSRDPMVPQTAPNLYLYNDADPQNKLDPSGLTVLLPPQAFLPPDCWPPGKTDTDKYCTPWADNCTEVTQTDSITQSADVTITIGGEGLEVNLGWSGSKTFNLTQPPCKGVRQCWFIRCTCTGSKWAWWVLGITPYWDCSVARTKKEQRDADCDGPPCEC